MANSAWLSKTQLQVQLQNSSRLRQNTALLTPAACSGCCLLLLAPSSPMALNEVNSKHCYAEHARSLDQQVSRLLAPLRIP